MLRVVVIDRGEDSLRVPSQLFDIGTAVDVMEEVDLTSILFIVRLDKSKK